MSNITGLSVLTSSPPRTEYVDGTFQVCPVTQRVPPERGREGNPNGARGSELERINGKTREVKKRKNESLHLGHKILQLNIL